MTYMKRLAYILMSAVLLSGLLPVTLGGCMETTKINNIAEAKAYMINYLDQKYGQQFVYKSGEKKNKEMDGEIDYSGRFALASDTSKYCDTVVYSTGDVIDNFSRYVFAPQLVPLCTNVLKDKPYIERYDVQLEYDGTRTWKQGDSIDEFLGDKGQSSPYDDVTVYLKKATDKAYAQEIKQLFDELNQVSKSCQVRLSVYDAKKVEIYFEMLDEVGKSKQSLADIELRIDEARTPDD
jgi:hypothetical protein